MNDPMTFSALDGHAERFTDESVGASIVIDYTDIFADCEPGATGGRIVFDSGDFETEEEADAALEAFFNAIIEEAPHDKG
jgi:hypothetical protein